MKYYLFICLVLCALNSFAQKESYMLVGTYTNGSSKGIYVFKFNSANGESKQVGFVKSSNPSFITVSPNEKYVYAVNEDADSAGSGGGVSSFSFDKITGLLTPINQKPSNGNHPCYVAIDKSGRWVIAGNYSSGTVAVLPVLKDGSLNNPVTTVQHYRKSINTERQNSPHVHATVLSPDNKFLFVPDLGLDKIMIYRFNKRRGKLKPATQPFIVTAPGTGPRHFVFHPNLARYFARRISRSYFVHVVYPRIRAFRKNHSPGPLWRQFHPFQVW